MMSMERRFSPILTTAGRQRLHLTLALTETGFTGVMSQRWLSGSIWERIQYILKRMTMTAEAQGQQEACPMRYLHTMRVRHSQQTDFQELVILSLAGTEVPTVRQTMVLTTEIR